MTAEELFLSYTLPIMGEKKEGAENYWEQFIPVLNIVLVDCLPLENGLLEYDGEEPMKEAPRIISKEDTIPYRDEIVRGVLPYGIASRLTIDDGEPNKTGFLEQNYVERYNSFVRARSTAVDDIWGDGE